MKPAIVTFALLLLAAGLAAAVPPALRFVDTTGLSAFAQGDREGAGRAFGLVAFFGHRDGMNNLAVLLLTGPDGARDREAARTLLERAAAKGHHVAAYNLSRIARNHHDTPLEDVSRILALLEPAIDAGDPHAAAEMADALYFRNRDVLVPDRAERRVALFRQAAESGDPIYLYCLGRPCGTTPDTTTQPSLSKRSR